jgi:hypothetical protein
MIQPSGGDLARLYTRRAMRSTVRFLAGGQRRLERMLAPPGTVLTPYVPDVKAAHTSEFKHCPCVFVLSTGRVGTETLAALLAQSSAVYSVHEPRPVLLPVTYEAYMSPAEDDRWVEVLRGVRGEVVASACARGQIYSETNPRMTFVANELAKAFPASRFIHLHRHPYQVIYSCMRRGHYKGHPGDYARIHPRPDHPYHADWDSMTTLEKVAWNWAESNSIALEFMKTLPPERRLNLSSDEMFKGSEATLRKLFAFVGVEVPSAMHLREVLQSQLNRQVGGTPVNRPEDWSDDEKQAVNAIVGDVASALDYDLGRSRTHGFAAFLPIIGLCYHIQMCGMALA